MKTIFYIDGFNLYYGACRRNGKKYRWLDSSLYERLALSRDPDKILTLASEGQSIKTPRDIFKAPYVLEFTGLEERSEYSETDLEQALIDNLRSFCSISAKSSCLKHGRNGFLLTKNHFM